jgi:hypothetical protein
MITEEEVAWQDTTMVEVEDPNGDYHYDDIDTTKYLTSQGFTKTGNQYDHDTWERTRSISNTIDTGLGRETSICFGEDLTKYVAMLKEDNYTPDLTNAIEAAIKEHGVENVMLLRESDEGMGGRLPEELRDLAKKAIHESEYH